MRTGFLANVSTAGKVLVLSSAFVVSFALLGAFSYYTITALGVNGAISSAAETQLAMRVVVGAGALLLLILILSIGLARDISRRMRPTIEFALKIARGDYTERLSYEQTDDVGRLSRALNEMTERMHTMTVRVQQGAEHVAGSSELITASAQRLAEGAQVQASTLEETSAAVEQLTASVGQVAESAQHQATATEEGASSMVEVRRSIEGASQTLAQISNLASDSVENALQGAKAVSEVMEGINLIAGSSEKIGGIVTVISDIADQTNLLALNASIEAARAGEHGRGFAVVADEVSKLADRSSDSTKEIETLIRESVENVTKGVEIAKGSQLAMEQIRSASEKVREMIAELSESVRQQVTSVTDLAGVIEKVSEMSQGISVATEEQTTNAQQVAKAVENVNKLTQEAASAAEDMSASTEQLTDMALQLMELTSELKVGGNDDDEGLVESDDQSTSTLDLEHIDRAIGAHGSWKLRLREAVQTGKTEWQVETVRRDDACVFGKWLAKLPANVRATDEGKQVAAYHTHFHRLVAGILEQVMAGQRQEAAKEIGAGSEFASLSSQLMQAMMEWKDSLSKTRNAGSRHHATPAETNGKPQRAPELRKV